jgi:hypothetical protein
MMIPVGKCLAESCVCPDGFPLICLMCVGFDVRPTSYRLCVNQPKALLSRLDFIFQPQASRSRLEFILFYLLNNSSSPAFLGNDQCSVSFPFLICSSIIFPMSPVTLLCQFISAILLNVNALCNLFLFLNAMSTVRCGHLSRARNHKAPMLF